MKVSQKQLSEIFNVSTRSIRDWDKEGCPSHMEVKNKIYETREVIDWHITRKLDDAVDSIKTDDDEVKQALRMQAIAKAEAAQADAEMKFIELSKRRNDVVLKEHVEELLSDLVAEINQALERIPFRYPSIIGVAKTDIERRDILKKAINEVKTLLTTINMLQVEESKDEQPETVNQE